MRKKLQTFISLVLVFILGSSLVGCGKKEYPPELQIDEDIPVVNTNTPESLTIWCLADNAFAPMIQEFAFRYSSQEGNPKVICTAFSREEDLTVSLEYEKPDMILYDDLTSFNPDEAPDYNFYGHIPESIFYPSVIDSVKSISSAIFPLGTQSLVLAVNKARYDSSSTCAEVSSDVFSSLESFTGLANAYSFAGEGLFYTADSFSDFIYTLMLSAGKEFSADYNIDITCDEYKYIYNLLAENALNGSLAALDNKAVINLGLGNIVCGIITSSDAAKIDPDIYDFYPVPLPRNSSMVCVGVINALGVTTWNASNLPYISDFIEQLFSDSSLIAATALDKGYIPSVYYSESASAGTLTHTLCTMADSYTQYLTSPQSVYYSNRESFETQYRNRLNILTD